MRGVVTHWPGLPPEAPPPDPDPQALAAAKTAAEVEAKSLEEQIRGMEAEFLADGAANSMIRLEACVVGPDGEYPAVSYMVDASLEVLPEMLRVTETDGAKFQAALRLIFD